MQLFTEYVKIGNPQKRELDKFGNIIIFAWKKVIFFLENDFQLVWTLREIGLYYGEMAIVLMKRGIVLMESTHCTIIYNQVISNQYTIAREILKICNWLFDDDRLEKFENFVHVFGQLADLTLKRPNMTYVCYDAIRPVQSIRCSL
jgi:hypothetical protein